MTEYRQRIILHFHHLLSATISIRCCRLVFCSASLTLIMAEIHRSKSVTPSTSSASGQRFCKFRHLVLPKILPVGQNYKPAPSPDQSPVDIFGSTAVFRFVAGGRHQSPAGVEHSHHDAIFAVFPVREWFYKVAAQSWSRTDLNCPKHLLVMNN